MSNAPSTIWSGQNGEYSTAGVNTIADASSKLLADASGNTIVDSGVTFTQTPATVWTQSDGTA